MSGWGCCLLFHRAADPAAWAGLPNRGFHLDLGYLERLIRHLQRTGWDIVTLDVALQRLAAPRRGRFVNISLDDGYRDTAEAVVPLFRRLQAPITLFIATGVPDGTMRLFFAGLESVIARRERVIADDRAYDTATAAEKRAAFRSIAAGWDASGGHEARYRQFCTQNGFDADALDAEHRITWPMLRTMRGDALVEIGAHTVSHPHVAALGAEAAARELGDSRARLEAELDQKVRHFAFPYGQPADCGERDFALARAAGFASAATTSPGLLGARTDPFRLPRHTINGEHRALPFAWAHLSGATRLAATVLRRG